MTALAERVASAMAWLRRRASERTRSGPGRRTAEQRLGKGALRELTSAAVAKRFAAPRAPTRGAVRRGSRVSGR